MSEKTLFYSETAERVMSVLTSSYGRRLGAAALALTVPLSMGGAGYALASGGAEGRPEVANECSDPRGMKGELDSAGYLGHDEGFDVAVRLENGDVLQLPTGTEFEILDVERSAAVKGPDGSTSRSELSVLIEQFEEDEEEVSVEGLVPVGWTTVDSHAIDSVTLCQRELHNAK